MIIDYQGKVRSRKIEPKFFRELISRAIVKHDLPFSYVEYDGVRDVWKYLNPEVKFMSRNTAASDVWKLYVDNKQNLKEYLAQIQGRICLTCDLWTAAISEGYLCLTTHYVDLEWKLCSKILAFCDMHPPNSRYEFSKKNNGNFK